MNNMITYLVMFSVPPKKVLFYWQAQKSLTAFDSYALFFSAVQLMVNPFTHIETF